ncbi:hypothetical protein OJJOAM_001208 [Cupriavidus sp. H18C1]
MASAQASRRFARRLAAQPAPSLAPHLPPAPARPPTPLLAPLFAPLFAPLLALVFALLPAPVQAAYRVQVEAPEPLKDILEEHLDLVRYRERADLGEDQIAYMVETVGDQVRAFAATEGWFDPQTTTRVEGQRRQPRDPRDGRPGRPHADPPGRRRCARTRGDALARAGRGDAQEVGTAGR